ncbi:hypothetical protein [Bacillus thuringiensis]|uniref:hypothetical protein n=1 Tax=Bacillus thuringiensis TaxID=1428 RepID=UPI0021D66A16|nr:hypothetical protein [Bacillus thuringiensis]MCU7666839.1 hypothetical protein [Bacillus thuringiensis]
MATNTNYEAKLGLLTMHIPAPAASLLKVGLHSGKFIIEEDFNEKIDAFPSNEALRDQLDYVINSEHDVLYLDADEERLKIWTNSQQAILRTSVFLNSLMGHFVTRSELEDFRMHNKAFSIKDYEVLKKEDAEFTTMNIMAGILDFSVWIQNHKLERFMISGDLSELYSDFTSHESLEELLDLKLSFSPNHKDIEFDSESGCFFAYTYTKESLIELIAAMNELVGVQFEEADKIQLTAKIDAVLSTK